jgi:hypothetical protein
MGTSEPITVALLGRSPAAPLVISRVSGMERQAEEIEGEKENKRRAILV